jgi:hypothetical protein
MKAIYPFIAPVLAAAFIAGCSQSIVRDPQTTATNKIGHCEGSEHVDHSSIAVIPLPVIAFFSPHADLHEIKPDDYLNRCGSPQQLANRELDLHKGGCIPASVTELITLGIWQWCPARVTWSADVTSGTTAANQLPANEPLPRTYISPEPEASGATTYNNPDSR